MEKGIELMKHVQKNPGVSISTLGDCGKTQIGRILKSKESLLALYESNTSASKVHTSFKEDKMALYESYTLACSKNIYPGGL